MSQRVWETNTQAERAAIRLNRRESGTAKTVEVILTKHSEAAT